MAKFGKSLSLPHPVGIVIGIGVIVGSNVKIMQGVTIGERSIESNSEHSYPIIGDNVQIGANSSILGNLRIGNNSKIGAHALILKDVKDGTTIFGVQSEVSPANNKS
jgi:serine O-acetyltransferase